MPQSIEPWGESLLYGVTRAKDHEAIGWEFTGRTALGSPRTLKRRGPEAAP